MISKSQVIFCIVSFVIIGFFVLGKAKEGFSQDGGTLGCCHTTDNTACVGCLEDCAISEELCGENSWNEDLRCVLVDGEFQSCEPGFGTGCCVISSGNCQNDEDFDLCNGTGIAWYLSTDCSEVSLCRTLIPTLNQGGKIITIAIIGLFAVIAIFAMSRRNAGTS